MGLVTATVIVQPPFGITPPVSTTMSVPEVAVTLPPQLFTRLFGVPTTNPAGNASVNAAPVILAAFVLPSVIVNVDVAPAASRSGENDFASVGRARTVRFALPTPGPVSLVVTETLFACVPTVPLITSTVTVHEPLPAMLPPDSENEPLVDPVVPPPQFPVMFGTAAVVIAAG